MKDLDHIRRITRLYPQLQGLRLLPLGLFMLVIAAQRLELVPFLGREGNCTVTLPLLVVVVLLWFGIGRYYNRAFGIVEPLENRPRQLLWSVLIWAGVIGVIILENVLGRLPTPPPFSLVELSFGIFYTYSGIKTQRWYYTLSGGVMLAASFLPGILGVGLDDRTFGSMGIAFLILLGITILLTSLLDHIQLVRAFPPAQGDAHAGNA